jgi:hypothetical protein
MKKALGGLAVLAVIGAIAGSHNSSSSGQTATASSAASASDSSATTAAHHRKKHAPEMTSGQKNALASARDYIDMDGFSKKGLIEQLSSSAGEGYSRADASFAANHVGADWNAEAVEAAKDYLHTMSMSKSGLIEQLSSSAGDRFTLAQAEYAADKVY